MTGRQRLLVLAACAVLVLAAAWFAGREGGADGGSDGTAPPSGSVRLGPEPGEDVAAYLARLGSELPAPGPSVLALVQFDVALTGTDALAASTGSTAVTAVFRVPLPRVQTALAFESLDPLEPAAALDAARGKARDAASDRIATAGSDRQRAVAAAERLRLADPACACVVALLVRADRAVLDTVATRADVRAVAAAPVGAAAGELALAPLLPEQTERADPPPDDGPVP